MLLPSGLAREPRIEVSRVSSTSCSQCGAAFEKLAWRKLELVERVALERVRELVTIWPEGTAIEVRLCVCGRPLARKAASESGA
jgi:hypothetical protein